jgi:hypothetical protein
VLGLLGGYLGYTESEDLPGLLDLAANIIAGSAPRAYRLAREHTTHQWHEEKLRAASERAARAWDSYAQDSVMGREYLASRGVLDVQTMGLVRFTANGDPAVALYDLEPGNRILNVVLRRRTLLGDAPKTPGLDACPTSGTFVGRIDDITPASVVVVVEGVFDALTARLAWPDAVVLGAHGASRLPQVAEAAAARKPRRMLLVPHDDLAGRRATADARAGVEALGLSFELVQLGSKDLNDAWRAGWRPAH